MFFGLVETITNQTVAVVVLVMIIGWLGLPIRQLFSLAPTGRPSRHATLFDLDRPARVWQEVIDRKFLNEN